jgi:integrase
MSKGLVRHHRSPNWYIKKVYRGVEIKQSTGTSSRAEAEEILEHLQTEIRNTQIHGLRPKVTFREASTRYLTERLHLPSKTTIAYHIEQLDPWIGDLDIKEVYDENLEEFKHQRLHVDGVRPSTLKKSLEVVRGTLNQAADSWRDPMTGKTWLEHAPKIKMPDSKLLAQTSDHPYALNHDELISLFTALGNYSPVQEIMCRFCFHTGLRESELRHMRWEWEQRYADLDRSVFFIPDEYHKNGRDRIVIMSDRARDILEDQRGKNDEWVFPNKRTGEPFVQLNTNQWQKAWRKCKLPTKGFVSGPHNLRHTLATRLQKVGATEFVIGQFLGHAKKGVTQHYTSADVKELIKIVNRADKVTASAIFRSNRVRKK